MSKLHVLFVRAFLLVLSGFAVSCLAYGQQEGSVTVFLPNQEVRVPGLPSLTAPSKSAALATALEIVLHDKAVCCGKDSALEDAALYTTLSGAVSLKEFSAKLQGKHLLNDGRPILVNAEYFPPSSMNAGLIVGALQDQHAALFEWQSHVYVLYGAIYNETRDYSGTRQYALQKLLLLDPRFSDRRREVVFDRETDDWEKVQGLLIPMVAPQ